MWNQILNQFIRICHQCFTWFGNLFGGMAENAAVGPWGTYFGIICSMLACRFVLYPFLKGRVIGGIGEEINIPAGSRSYSAKGHVQVENYAPEQKLLKG